MDTQNQLHPLQPIHKSSPSIATLVRRSIAALGVSALMLAACGSDGDPVTTGSDTENSSLSEEDGGTSDDPTSTDDGESLADKAGELSQPVENPDQGEQMADDISAEGIFNGGVSGDVDQADILDPKKWEIESATVDPSNDQAILVTYSAGSPPCTQAFAEVAESDDAVKVTLQVGLHPDVAAMSCVAQIVEGEISVPLSSPLGDRTIELDQP